MVSQGRGRTQEAIGRATRNPPEVGRFRTLSCFWLACDDTQRERLCAGVFTTRRFAFLTAPVRRGPFPLVHEEAEVQREVLCPRSPRQQGGPGTRGPGVRLQL